MTNDLSICNHACFFYVYKKQVQADKKQFEKILRYIELGKREGATLLTGGKAVGNQGYYIEPTVFINVKVSSKLMKLGICICIN